MELFCSWALDRDLFLQMDCNTPQYEKDTKQPQNKSMESTDIV